MSNVTPIRADIRPPPADLEVEQAVLGAILLNNASFDRYCRGLRQQDFTSELHRRILTAIADLRERELSADIFAVKLWIEQRTGIVDPELPKYLGALVAGVVTIVNLPHYVEQLRELTLRRELIELGQSASRYGLSDIHRRLSVLLDQSGGALEDAGQRIDPALLDTQPVPARRWLVHEWVPVGYVTLISGSGGIGKSLLAQQLGTSVATGSPWLGLPVTRGRCLYFACEDGPDELHRRQADINRAYGCSFGDLVDFRWLARFGCDNILMAFPGGVPSLTTAYFDLLREARQFAPQVIIVDTVADTFGGNENDRGQVRHFVQACLGRLARELDCAVAALAHPSRTGQADGSGQSGSTGWDASVRARLYLATPASEGGQHVDDDRRELRRKKANYSARGDWISLRWVDGCFVAENVPHCWISAAASRARAERVFMELLQLRIAQGRSVSDKPRASTYAPKVFAEMEGHEGCTVRDFQIAMEALFKGGKIVLKPYGSPSDDRHRIEPSSGTDASTGET